MLKDQYILSLTSEALVVLFQTYANNPQVTTPNFVWFSVGLNYSNYLNSRDRIVVFDLEYIWHSVLGQN